MHVAEYIPPWQKLPATYNEASNVDKRILLARSVRACALASRVVLRQMCADIYKDLDSLNAQISSIAGDIIRGKIAQGEADPVLQDLYSQLNHLTIVRKQNEREGKLADITIRKNDRLIKRLLPRSETLVAQEAPSHRQAN